MMMPLNQTAWRYLPLLCAIMFSCGQTTVPTTQASQKPREKNPSEDAMIWDFHKLGEINGTTNLFRSASPIRDLEKKSKRPDDQSPALARERLKHFHDLGIRTIISFEQPQPADVAGEEDKTQWVALEQAAAKDAGITYISHPMRNAGPNSLQTLAPAAVLQWLQAVEADLFRAAKIGGVDFHCSAGHDRTGIVTAYLRMKYEHWTVDAAIQEMRDCGHNWPKYSANGGISSWHEQTLRAIAPLLITPPTTGPTASTISTKN